MTAPGDEKPTDDLPGVKLEEVTPEEAKPRKRGRRLLYVFGILTGLMVLVCGGAAGGLALYVGSVDDKVKKEDVFAGIPEAQRPPKPTAEAMNILLLGSDSRALQDETNGGDARSDTMILVHLPADRQKAQLISIPRDTWVDIPGHGKAKINAALNFGGKQLAVQTVEAFTHVRIDHVVVIDFYGFKDVVDSIGGIDIQVDEDFTSVHPPKRKFTKGLMHMNGEVALDYSRQRKQFKDGDFARIEHQQQVIRAVLNKAVSSGFATDLPKLNSFIRATAGSLTVDTRLSLFDLALELRNLRGNDLVFLTSPSKGTGTAGGQSVVFTDPVKAPELFAAVNSDQVGAWLNANPSYGR